MDKLGCDPFYTGNPINPISHTCILIIEWPLEVSNHTYNRMTIEVSNLTSYEVGAENVND